MIDSIILGLIQGLTEFLPVSSSGHLILAREILHLPLQSSLSFDIFLNTATLLAVIFCFWGDLKRLSIDFLTEGFSTRSKNLIYALILGTIPAGLVGFLYSDWIENTFRTSSTVTIALIAGSLIMFLADFLNKKYAGKTSSVTPIKGFMIGIFQALALIPGISRSGSSISGGLLAKVSREEAIKFSFLLLIPVSCGALLKVIIDTRADFSVLQFSILQSFVAFFVALISGIWAVKFLVRYLSKNSFTVFIIYRLLLAVTILALL